MKFEFRDNEWIEGESPRGEGPIERLKALAAEYAFVLIPIGAALCVWWYRSGYQYLEKFCQIFFNI